MNKFTKNILTDQRLVTYHKNWFQKLDQLFYGNDPSPVTLMGIHGEATDPFLIYQNPEQWVTEALENLADQIPRKLPDQKFVPVCIETAFYGVHFVDKILGADVFFQDDQWYNHYLDCEVGTLQKPDLETNETWNLAKRAALAFLDQKTTVPLFGLPTIASALNIAVNLYGEEMLATMLEDPDAAEHDLRIINDVLMEIHGWYLKHIPPERLQPVISWARTQPPGHGQICGCTTQLVSPNLYEEFIFPLDNELLGIYPKGGMIHLCGSHSHLIPLFARMDNLKSVQLNDRAAEDLPLYVEGLREDQVIYLNPCEEMSAETGLKIAAGKKLVLVTD